MKHEFLKHLRKDHDEQKQLGKRMAEATAPKDRERLRRKFHDSLYPHLMGEEASIFKRLQQVDDEEAKKDCLENLREHREAMIALRELMVIEAGSGIFQAKAKALDELNRHHIEHEEGKTFGHLERLFDRQELDRLFEQYEKTEEGKPKF
ncbi:MAG: hemerythrin domain-containing protein [Thermodesulfobacteriota bacterium]